MSTESRRNLPKFEIGTVTQLHEVPDSGVFSIGRLGDLAIGEDDRLMHRTLLEITAVGDDWQITNCSPHYRVNILGDNDLVLHSLLPQTATRVRWEDFLISVSVGGKTYVMDAHVDYLDVEDIPEDEDDESSLSPVETTDLDPLDAPQRMIIAALASKVFQSGDYGQILKTSEASQLLGWSANPKRLERKLDRLCHHLRDLVPGLVGSKENLPRNRKVTLVQFCLDSNLVTIDDLKLVEAERKSCMANKKDS
ncbi:hypothetical protein GP475_03500 [Corynebacterium poyangense]|uniref:Uncharacterized protein n=1 Tax=Corynebacterium poyangense TaxID=2684405 RepID=A0A7H0SMP4_9CORY|nr:hypothetical protein [Corynebacterium poyangense]QNQ89819.1 hypothetical protein GP475_03500 [Corynebacterium poyangense]